MVGALMILCRYTINMYQIKNSVSIIPLIIPGLNVPGKNGVAKEDKTLKTGIINIKVNIIPYFLKYLII